MPDCLFPWPNSQAADLQYSREIARLKGDTGWICGLMVENRVSAAQGWEVWFVSGPTKLGGSPSVKSFGWKKNCKIAHLCCASNMFWIQPNNWLSRREGLKAVRELLKSLFIKINSYIKKQMKLTKINVLFQNIPKRIISNCLLLLKCSLSNKYTIKLQLK